MIVTFLFFITSIYAYHHGGNDTNCWLGPNYAKLLDPCPIASIEILTNLNDTLYTNEPFELTSRLILASNLTLESVNGYLIQHANIHMCKAEVGWCTPDV